MICLLIYNGTSKNVVVDGGEAKVTFSDVSAGAHIINVEYWGDDYNMANSTTAKLTVRIDSTVKVDNVSLDYDEYIIVEAITEGASGITAKIDDGEAKVISNVILIPKGLDGGNHTLTVTTIPDEFHNSVSENFTVTVNKLKTALTASAVTTVYNGGKYLTITLKDANGKVIKGVKLKVVINGKTYTPKTDGDGKAKVSTNNIAPKVYTVKITFDGNVNYSKSTKSVKVTVKKATSKITAKAKKFKRSVKTKKYTITLKNNKNKVIKKAKVTLKVNGKTYKAKTNSKGKATFKITKLTKKGKYTAKVKYSGNKYYKAKTVKAKISVK